MALRGNVDILLLSSRMVMGLIFSISIRSKRANSIKYKNNYHQGDPGSTTKGKLGRQASLRTTNYGSC
jgi:hypothetical protein